MARSLSREFQLAAACAMWPPSEQRSRAILEAAAGPVDWDHFLRVVTRHHVTGLAQDGLTRTRLPVPTGIAQRINADAEALALKDLALAAESARLQRLFSNADVLVFFLKGTSLAMLAYNNLRLRHSKDIDLFVLPETLPTATAILERSGYRRWDPPATTSATQMRLLQSLRRDFGYAHELSGIEIELHWRLFSNPYATTDALLTPAERIVPITRSIELRTFADEDLFAYLCAHGASHSWFRLKWLADIGALLAAAGSENVVRLYDAAEARGAGRAAAQALLLCRRLLDVELPEDLNAKLNASPACRLLEITALKAMTRGNAEAERAQLPLGTTLGSLSSFLLGSGWRFWAAEMKIHGTCETDVLALPLPARLHFLYPLLRFPLWVWRQLKRGAERAQ